jgi:hypothetical protein
MQDCGADATGIAMTRRAAYAALQIATTNVSR